MNALPWALELVALLVLASGVMGGIQYALFIALLLYFYRTRDFAFWHRLSLFIPLIFVIPAGLLLQIYVSVVYHDPIDMNMLGAIFFYGLIVAYGYVALYRLLTCPLRYWRVINDVEE